MWPCDRAWNLGPVWLDDRSSVIWTRSLLVILGIEWVHQHVGKTRTGRYDSSTFSKLGFGSLRSIDVGLETFHPSVEVIASSTRRSKKIGIRDRSQAIVWCRHSRRIRAQRRARHGCIVHPGQFLTDRLARIERGRASVVNDKSWTTLSSRRIVLPIDIIRVAIQSTTISLMCRDGEGFASSIRFRFLVDDNGWYVGFGLIRCGLRGACRWRCRHRRRSNTGTFRLSLRSVGTGLADGRDVRR